LFIVLFVFDTDEFFLATLGDDDDDDDDDDEFIAALVEDKPVVLEDDVDRCFDGWTSIGRFVSIGAVLLLSKKWLPSPLLRWLSSDET
jgi:hypothetical protein